MSTFYFNDPRRIPGALTTHDPTIAQSVAPGAKAVISEARWRIQGDLDGASAWKVLAELDPGLSWRIADELANDASWRVLDEVESPPAWKIFNERSCSISWKIYSPPPKAYFGNFAGTGSLPTQERPWGNFGAFSFPYLGTASQITQELSWKITTTLIARILSWLVFNAPSNRLRWRILKDQEQSSAWRVLKDLQAQAAWSDLGADFFEAGWGIVNAGPTPLAWGIVNATPLEAARTVQRGLSGSTSWKLLNVLAKGIASGILADRGVNAAWRILNEHSREASWRVLDAWVGDSSWTTMEELDHSSSWQLLTQLTSGVSWDVLTDHRFTVPLSWRILNELDRQLQARILENGLSDTSWRIADRLSARTAWKVDWRQRPIDLFFSNPVQTWFDCMDSQGKEPEQLLHSIPIQTLFESACVLDVPISEPQTEFEFQAHSVEHEFHTV